MAILRPQLDPSAGIPSPVMLQPRRRMTQAAFYQQQQNTQPAQPQYVLGDTASQQQPSSTQQPQQRPVDQVNTYDSILGQFQRLAQRPAPPQLDPGARVQSPNMELVQPSNFESFYKRLSALRDSNEALLGAAQARSAYQRMQATQLQSIANQRQAINAGRSSGGGQAFGSGIPSNPAANFKYAQNIAGNYGWGANELQAWYTLGMKESGWRNTAQNPTSTAYGIGQFLNSTWAGVGIGKTSDPALQVEAMARYIKNRYGSPSRALAFHLSHNWY